MTDKARGVASGEESHYVSVYYVLEIADSVDPPNTRSLDGP